MSTTGTTTIGIHFGPLADPIEKQLNEQGFTLNGDEEYQQSVDAINLLWLDNIITSTEKNKMCDRLFKRICKSAKPLQK